MEVSARLGIQSGGASLVVSLEATNIWKLDDPPARRRLHGALIWRVHLQGLMDSPPMVEIDVRTDNAAQVPLVKDNELAQFGIDAGAARLTTLTLAAPVVAEAPFLPLEHGSRPDETKPSAPTRPQACEPGPEHPVAGFNPKSARSASVMDGELMAQRNNLQLKREPPAERGDEEMHQCNAECSHGSVV